MSWKKATKKSKFIFLEYADVLIQILGMQTSEPFLPFSQNLLCRRIRFDDKLDLVDRIIPIDDKTCLLIDRTHSFHLKSYSPDDEETIAKQFPLPPYAKNSNPNVLYSVDYMDLYYYLNKKKISQVDVEDYIYHLDRDRTKYIQFVYLGDYKLAVQLGKSNLVCVIDLRKPDHPPVILHDVFEVRGLVSVSNSCLAWYEKRTGLVFLYHYFSEKRKVLKFCERKTKGLYSLKDHVIIAVSKQYLEILDYSKNKVIKSVGFVNSEVIPYVVVSPEGNIISYLDGKMIHILKTEKGKIKWKNHYDLKDYSPYSKYVFINQNLIALETPNAIHILLLDSQSFSLHTVIQHPWLGFLETSGLEYRCCERACKRGFVMNINSLGNNSFAVVECVCKGQHFLHGQQRMTMFCLENLKEEDLSGNIPNVLSITFQMRRSIILEEFRDPVRVIDVLNGEGFALFITERGVIYRVNLKSYSVEDAVELSGLLLHSGVEMRKIDKFFALSGNIVAITTKIDSSPYARIMIFSLETRTVEWDSRDATSAVGEDGVIEEDFSFYDVVKLNPNQMFVSYNTRKNNTTLYKVGDITCNNDSQGEEKYSLFEYNVRNLTEGAIFDRLWSLEESRLVAMRHGENVFNLSFLDPSQDEVKITKRFSAEKYFSVINVHIWGILDVKSINKDVICLQIKMNTLEFVVLVYNIETGDLLNQIETEYNMIGTIRRCYREAGVLHNLEKMMIFGYFAFVENGLCFESVKDLMSKNVEPKEVVDLGLGLCVTSRNFKPLARRNHALIYENDHHKNFVCILKSPNFKLECLRILRRSIGNAYHKYVYKDVVDMIFGTQ